MGQIAGRLLEQSVETHVSIRKYIPGDGNPFTPEARGSFRHEQALHRYVTNSEGGQA